MRSTPIPVGNKTESPDVKKEAEAKIAEEKEALIQDMVKQFFEVVKSEKIDGSPVSRTHNLMRANENIRMRDRVLRNIQEDKTEVPEVKHAAEILLLLGEVMNVVEYKKPDEALPAFIEAIKNPNLTVKYANVIYLCYCQTCYAQKQDRNLASQWLKPNLTTPLWQKTMLEVRGIVLDKLKKEVAKIESPEGKIQFLEDAKKLPILRDHRKNFVIAGSLWQTKSLDAVDVMISDVKKAQKASPGSNPNPRSSG
ncbi:MAG TPA: hypothetical protein VLI69_07930 [Gammaproteobacteria bacterium]|nr:hypothetical protein [Gammaproteobacteria bacterium]